ncbi:PAS domain S-box protein [Thiohalorhabdus methylotrophus]|uniref:histidine kinase n=1 Tax=Thiohalorhabdus methylotrophus TaxID=3242694 RepID=A0ABV4TTQ3_9GAMM
MTDYALEQPLGRPASDTLLGQFFRRSPQPQLLLQPDPPRVLEANASFLSQFGYHAGGISGCALHRLFPAETTRARVELQRTSQESAACFEIDMALPGGSACPVEVQVTRLSLEEQPLLHVSVQDLRDRAREREQAGLFATLLGPFPDIVFYKDIYGAYRGGNAAFEKLLGRSLEEAIGRTDEQLFPREVAEACAAGDRKVLAWNQPRHDEEWVRYPDGEWVLLDTVKTPFIGPHGEIRGLVAVSRDATDRHRAQEKLREQERRYRQILATAQEGFWMGRYEDLVTLDVNDALCTLLGRTRTEMIGRPPTEWLDAPNREILQQESAQRDRDQHRRYEISFLHKDGSAVPVMVQATTARDSAGNPDFIFAFVTDLTWQKAAERALRESENRYRAIVEQSPDPILLHDGRRLLYANESMARLVQAESAEELIGTSIFDLVPTEEAEHVGQRSRRLHADQGQGSLFAEGQALRRDGSRVEVEVHGRLIRYQGMPTTQVILRDITARKEAERAQERLLSILEASPDLIAMSDREGNILYLNPAARRFLGERSPDSHQVGGDQPPWAARQIREEGLPVAARSGLWRGETAFYDREGQEVPFSQTIVAHFNDQGEVERFSSIARDLSEQKAAEAREKTHREQFNQARRLISMGEIATILAHQLNQPLAAAVNYIQAGLNHLPRESDPPSTSLRASLERAMGNIQKAGEIVSNVRGFLKGEEAHFQPTDLNALVRDLLSHLDSERRAAHVELTTDLADPSPVLPVDPILIQEGLLNLVRNALDANREAHGEEPSRVTVRTRRCPHGATVAVEDEGPGLPEPLKNEDFAPFFTTKSGGLGLGLWIVRSIAETHNGNLHARNNDPGPGATFTIFLRQG